MRKGYIGGDVVQRSSAVVLRWERDPGWKLGCDLRSGGTVRESDGGWICGLRYLHVVVRAGEHVR